MFRARNWSLSGFGKAKKLQNSKRRYSKRKRAAQRRTSIQPLENRLLLFASFINFYSCPCDDEEAEESTENHDVNVSEDSGNADVSSKSEGGGTTNSTGTNPHPIVRFQTKLTQAITATDYVKATLTLWPSGSAQGGDPVDVVYMQHDAAVDTLTNVLFTFQLDASNVPTGRYLSELRLDYFDQNDQSLGTSTGAGPEVNIVNRSKSVFGNRWWLDGLDQLYPQANPSGALFVRDDGTALWYKNNGGVYDAADGDPAFATLTFSSNVYTLTARDGSKRVFDSAGKLTSKVDPEGNTTTYAWSSNQLSRITDQAGHQVGLEYFTSGDFNGQLQKLRKVLTVDGSNNILTALDTVYAYDKHTVGSDSIFTVTSITRPDPDGTGPLSGPKTEYTYTSYVNGYNWLLTDVSEPEVPGQPRKTMQFSYDFAGRVDTITHFDGTYELLNPAEVASLAESSSAADPATMYFDPPPGSRIDAAGQESRFTMDRFGRIVQTEDATGYVVDYNRDSTYGIIDSIVEADPDGTTPFDDLQTDFTYTTDGKKNLLTITWPDGGVREWQNYDAKNRAADFYDELDRHTYFYFDTNTSSRLPLYIQQIVGTKESISYNTTTGAATGASDDIVWSFLYTGSGTAGVPAGLVKKAYDPLGRMTEYDYYTSSASTLPQRGQLKSSTYPAVSGETTPRKTEYEYDDNGFLDKIIESGQSVTTRETNFLNDNLGRLLKTTLADPDGAGGSEYASPEYRYFYDTMSRLVAMVGPKVTATSSAPSLSTSSITVNAASDALYTDIDLTQYFSDDVDGKLALTYVVTGNDDASLFDAIRFPSDRPGHVVFDHKKDLPGTAEAAVTIKAIDSDNNVSSTFTINFDIAATEEFRINESTTNSQRRPTIASLTDGGFVAVWMEQVNTGAGSNEKIVGRVMNADGTARGADFTIQDGVEIATTSQYPPAVTVTEDGVIVIAWFHLDGSDYDVFFKRYELDNTSATAVKALDASAQAIATDSDNDQYVPVLAALPKTGFIAAWYGGYVNTTAADVFYRRFDSSGFAIDAQQVTVNTTTANGQFRPSMAVGDDGFVVSWQGNGTGDSYGVFARKFDRTGAAMTTAEQRLNVDYTDDLQRDTDTAYLEDGSFVVVWQGDTDSDPGTDAYDIFYRRIDVDGSPIGTAETLVNTTSGQAETSPEVTALHGGGFTAAWHRADASSQGVFSRTFSASYVGDTGETAVNVTTTNNQYFTDLITHSDGSLVYAWEGNGSGDSAGVFGRFYPVDPVVSGSYRVTGLELGPVVRGKSDYVIVSFSEPIVAGSVGTGDFSLTGPGGSVTITSATAISATQALVGFSSYASTAGTYTFTVATSIQRASDSANLGSSYTTEFYRAEGPVTTYHYDAANLLGSEINPLGGRTTFSYDVRGDLVAENDSLARTTRYQYDARRLLTRLVLPDPDDGGALVTPDVEYQYDDAGNLQTMIDALSGTTDYEYDSRHRLIDILEPDPDSPGSGNPRLETTFQYNLAGELELMVDQFGVRHTNEYDTFGRLRKSSRLATIHVNDYTLDDDTAAGDPSYATTGTWSVHGTPGFEDDYQDIAGAGSETATATWNFIGLSKYKTYEVFVTWVPSGSNATNAPYTVYDGTTSGTALGTTGLDQSSTPGMAVDLFDDANWHSLGDFTLTNTTTLTVKLGNNANGRVVADAVRIVESSPTTYQYYKNGNVEKITDALGNVTQQLFDARDRLTDVYLPDPSTGQANQSGPHTVYGYDAMGNLTSLTDPVGNVTSWAYDYLNRAKSETDERSEVREFKFDNAGNVNKIIDRNGRVRKFSFDRLYRMTKEEWFADVSDATADRTISFAFDLGSQLTGVTDRDASGNPIAADYSYAYDKLGRISQSTSDLVGLSSSQLVFQEFVYDAMSRRTEAKASYGSLIGSATKDYKNTYVYNAAGQLTEIRQQGQTGGNTVGEKRVDYAYGQAGELNTITRYKALAGGSGNEGIESEFSYDNLVHLAGINHADAGTSRASYTWTRDAMGRIRSVNMTGLTEDVQSYTYDASGQLTLADRTVGSTNDESYSYDLNGNRTMSGYTTGDDNRITSDGVYDYRYDDEGNLIEREKISDGTTTFYTWDHRNRLVAVTERPNDNPASTPTKIVSYEYDAFNHRVSKTLNSNGTGNPERYEFYVWDGDDIVLDFVDADGGASPSASLDKRYLWGTAVDQILAEEAVGGSTRWHLTDHQGTVRDLADGDGNLVGGSHVDFSSFGKIVSGTPATRFTFTGQEYDSDTGLYYYNARWYNPNIGRWISKDPIGFNANDTNLYRYVGNDATNAVDPSGLVPWWVSDYFEHLFHPSTMDPDLQAYNKAAYCMIGVGAGGLAGAGVAAAGGGVIASGVASGAVGGGISAVPDGEVIEGALIGGATGGALGAASAVLRPAAAVTGQVRKGATVYRVVGGASDEFGSYWTTVDPTAVPLYRSAAGLRPGNTGQAVVVGKLKDVTGIIVGTAAPSPATQAGALMVPEVFVPNPALQIQPIVTISVSPPF